MYPYSHGWCQGHPPAWWHIRCRCSVTLLSAIPSLPPSVTHRVTIAIPRLQQSLGHGHRLSVRHYSALTTSEEALFYHVCVSCGDAEWRNISIPMWVTEQTGNCALLENQKTRRLSLIRLIFPWRSDSRLDAVFSLFVVCYSDNKDFLFKVPWGSIFEFDFALYLRVTRTCTRTQMGVAFRSISLHKSL